MLNNYLQSVLYIYNERKISVLYKKLYIYIHTAVTGVLNSNMKDVNV